MSVKNCDAQIKTGKVHMKIKQMHSQRFKQAVLFLLIISIATVFSGCGSGKSKASSSSKGPSNTGSTGAASKAADVKSNGNVEALIKTALSGSDTYVFQIQRDFKFKTASGAATSTNPSKGQAVGSALPDATARGLLIGFVMGSTFRVNSKSVTMDATDYRCKLSVLKDNGGIRIEITRGNSMSVNQGHLAGVIKGNTLTASAEVSSNTVVNHIGNGMGGAGEFTVSVKRLDKDQQPPKPVNNLKIRRNPDKSIILTWEDPNPKDMVESYEIYRTSGSIVRYSKAATIPYQSSWVDTSSDARADGIVNNAMLGYYMIVHAKNGMDSPSSNLADLYK